jgi:proteic killer suppression protein
MILSFKDRRTRVLYEGAVPKGFPAGVATVTRRKLAMLDVAIRLDDLRAPPGNRLHALAADRAGSHAIRVNDQYRICFVWTAEGPTDVELVDYH